MQNRYAFTNLSKFVPHWTLSEDGVTVDQGTLTPVDLAPGASKELTLPIEVVTRKPGREYFLQLSFGLAKPEIWAKAGYEVATQRFVLPPASEDRTVVAQTTGALSLRQDPD